MSQSSNTGHTSVNTAGTAHEGTQKHHEALCKQLMVLYAEEKYADFNVVPKDGDPIPCHKVIMSAMSPFFDVMLDNPMEETLSGRVALPFDTETVQLVLEYIYSGQNLISPKTVTMLYDAANYLQISSLVEDCEQFLKKNITEEICLEIWIVSKKFNSMDVAEISRSMVLQGFAMFCTYDHMLITPLEDLIELLSDPYINCTGTLKCKAAWLWLLAHSDVDDKNVERLIQTLVGAKNVENADILNSCKEAVEISHDIDVVPLQRTWEIVCKKMWISADEVAYSTPRVNHSKEECFVILFCDKSGKNKLFAFDFKKKKWYDLNVQEKDLGHRYAICSRDSFLYVSGGTRSPKGFLYFTGIDKQWHDEKKMPEDREQHVMHNIKGRMYVLGGTSNAVCDLWDVAVYNCKDDTWSTCGQVAKPVVAASSVQIGDSIVLLGGSVLSEGRGPSDTLQCYETATNTSSILDVRLPFKAKSHTMSVTLFNNGIYIVHNAVMYYLEPFARKPRDEVRKNLPGVQRVRAQIEMVSEIDIDNPPIKGFAVTSFGNKILLIGGEDKTFTTKKSIIQFDTELKQSVLLTVSTPLPIKDLHFTKMFVPHSWEVADLE